MEFAECDCEGIVNFLLLLVCSPEPQLPAGDRTSTPIQPKLAAQLPTLLTVPCHVQVLQHHRL